VAVKEAALTMKASGLLDTHVVAQILGCSSKHVRNLIRANKLPAYKIGKRTYRIKREDVYEYLRNNRVNPEDFYA